MQRRLGKVRLVAPAAALTILCLGAGCYRYTQVAFDQIEPGREVRLHLSDTGAVRYASQLGMDAGAVQPDREIHGEVVASSDSQLVLGVRVPAQIGATYSPLRQRVTFTPADVSLAQLKALDRTRMTIIGVVGGVAIAALLAHYVGGVFGGNTEPGPGPGSELAPYLR